jgi:hypothetical protein
MFLIVAKLLFSRIILPKTFLAESTSLFLLFFFRKGFICAKQIIRVKQILLFDKYLPNLTRQTE